MYVTADQLMLLGISRNVLERKLANGEWEMHTNLQNEEGNEELEVTLSSLPKKLQLKWALNNLSPDYPEQTAALLSEGVKYGVNKQESEINKLLLPLTRVERVAWINESIRFARIIERCQNIKPKRRRNSQSGKWEFVPEVLSLLNETACKDPIILARQPHRANPLSPYTLDDLSRAFRLKGLVVFLPRIQKPVKGKKDKRCAVVSDLAIKWINKNWRNYSGANYLYKDLEREARNQGWKIPSRSWIYRQWIEIPKIVREYLHDRQTYEAKSAPYVPRDYSDLDALQILCGDHSERDVTVSLPDKTITRPWLTVWYDLRTGLIWGWCLCLTPSSFTAGLAYADGVRNFGAQPISRPDQHFYSYIYTDRGRDYKSHHLNGKDIVVHKEAMRIDGGLEMLLTQRRVGILDELNIKHLFSKGRNPKERAVERVFNDISGWEQNTFKEYCGRHAKDRPEPWYKLYAQHQRLQKRNRITSPFMPLDQYREELARFITRYNSTEHERPTLGSIRTVPIEEYKRLYTTRYEIASETLALLLMKSEKRTIGKNGVQCFRKHWSYFHEAMSLYKGKSVEIRYSDDDYNSVMVILPDMRLCEAQLITPTSILNPNKETLKVIRMARANERMAIRKFDLIAQSQLRGETVEDRIARGLESESGDESLEDEYKTLEDVQGQTGNVHQLTRLDHTQLVVTLKQDVTSTTVGEEITDTSIFTTPDDTEIKDFDYGGR